MLNQTLARVLLGVGVLAGAASSAYADTIPDVRITEFMYKNENSPGEFIQFTNLGTTAVDMTGWSEDAGTKVGVHSLSSFGVLQPGQSAILAQATQSAFDSAWNLASTVPYAIENSSDNLGNGDTITLFNASGAVIDNLVYGTSPRSDGVAVVPGSAGAVGTNDYTGWVLLSAGQDGAFRANGSGDIGSPGFSSFAPSPVPLPAAAWLLVSGLGVLTPALRRRKAAQTQLA
ncbi:MAG TPA: lamin tail domain-containing protein [Steroidobacteraceae bacterium]|jgi:hypothetical protein